MGTRTCFAVCFSGMEMLPFDFAFEHYPLAPLTMYNVGGPARLALLPRSVEEACAAYRWLSEQDCPRLLLGGGSNVLIDDEGFDGVVLVTTGLSRVDALGGDRYRVEAGLELDMLVRDIMLPNNYHGVGGLTGIPGTVGGALYMNAGTVNGSTCQLAESVTVIGPEGRRDVMVSDSLYGYRGQRFCPPGSLILAAVFRFTAAAENQRSVYEHYRQRRLEKQPQGYCCGSVFRNPDGDHAGRLIEACGLKGARRGGAVVSPQHANFIMNDDGASSQDIMGLIELCRQRVLDQFGVRLETEVVIVGAGPAQRLAL